MNTSLFLSKDCTDRWYRNPTFIHLYHIYGLYQRCKFLWLHHLHIPKPPSASYQGGTRDPYENSVPPLDPAPPKFIYVHITFTKPPTFVQSAHMESDSYSRSWMVHQCRHHPNGTPHKATRIILLSHAGEILATTLFHDNVFSAILISVRHALSCTSDTTPKKNIK